MSLSSFCCETGLGGDVVDFTVVTALVQDLLLIVPLLLLARAAKWLIKDLPGTGLRLAATVVFDLAGLWYLIGNLHIPPDLIRPAGLIFRSGVPRGCSRGRIFSSF